MKVEMLKTDGGLERGKKYVLPPKIAVNLIRSGLAKEASAEKNPELAASKSMKPDQVERG